MSNTNTKSTKTLVIAPGSSYTVPDGFCSLDMLYQGTSAAPCTFLGDALQSVPVPLPPNMPFSFEYNNAGYKPVVIDNSSGDGPCNIVIK